MVKSPDRIHWQVLVRSIRGLRGLLDFPQQPTPVCPLCVVSLLRRSSPSHQSRSREEYHLQPEQIEFLLGVGILSVVEKGLHQGVAVLTVQFANSCVKSSKKDCNEGVRGT